MAIWDVDKGRRRRRQEEKDGVVEIEKKKDVAVNSTRAASLTTKMEWIDARLDDDDYEEEEEGRKRGLLRAISITRVCA